MRCGIMYVDKEINRFRPISSKNAPEVLLSLSGDFFMYARAHGTGSAYRLSPPSSHLRISSTSCPASMDINRFNK